MQRDFDLKCDLFDALILAIFSVNSKTKVYLYNYFCFIYIYFLTLLKIFIYMKKYILYFVDNSFKQLVNGSSLDFITVIIFKMVFSFLFTLCAPVMWS